MCVCFVFRLDLYVSVNDVLLAHTKHQDPLFIVYIYMHIHLFI